MLQQPQLAALAAPATPATHSPPPHSAAVAPASCSGEHGLHLQDAHQCGEVPTGVDGRSPQVLATEVG